jgi:hypothetical protein
MTFHPRHLKATNLSGVIAILFTLSQNGFDCTLGAIAFGQRWVVLWVDPDGPGNTVYEWTEEDDTVIGAINKMLDRIGRRIDDRPSSS